MEHSTLVDILLVEDNPTDAELALAPWKKTTLADHVVWVKDGRWRWIFCFRARHLMRTANTLPRVVVFS